MKTKNILIGILSLMTFATYAQSEKSKKVETKTAVTELKVETENLEELKNLDWKLVKATFQENEVETENLEELKNLDWKMVKATFQENDVETENLDELENLDWEKANVMFQENDTEQEITLAFTYVNKSDDDKTKVRVDNFEMKLTGKKANLDKMTSILKKLFDNLDEIDGQNIKN
ncbi:MAG: hypothetical protein GY834_17065 [Bacteroidetes bacterium]|nr:hypothetical protein [Bacteroidota bacterium]